MRTGGEVIESVPGSRTIDRALRVLDSFTTVDRRWRTTALAQHCELPIPTTHRILGTLRRFGYVVRGESGEYGLGPAAASFAPRAPAFGELRQVAWPALRAIHRATGERVTLSALAESRDHGCEVCALDADAEQICAKPPAPRIRPLHAGAAGKVLLAQLDNEDLTRALGSGLERIGPTTITRPERLRREVAAIRRRGWGFSREEIAVNTWSVAVPVADSPPDPACALAVSAPLTRCDAERARHDLSVLASAARWLASRRMDPGREPIARSRGMTGPRFASFRGPRSGREREAANVGAHSSEHERGDPEWQTA